MLQFGILLMADNFHDNLKHLNLGSADIGNRRAHFSFRLTLSSCEIIIRIPNDLYICIYVSTFQGMNLETPEAKIKNTQLGMLFKLSLPIKDHHS